jgi:hypothetical protein
MKRIFFRIGFLQSSNQLRLYSLTGVFKYKESTFIEGGFFMHCFIKYGIP